MSNVIQFLETMSCKQLSTAEYAASVAALEVDGLRRQALLDRDQAALNALLGGRAEMHCMILGSDIK